MGNQGEEYFLFGEEAVNEYFDNGVSGITKEFLEQYGGEVKIFPQTITTSEVLAAYSGWTDYAQITKEEYETIKKVIDNEQQ